MSSKARFPQRPTDPYCCSFQINEQGISAANNGPQSSIQEQIEEAQQQQQPWGQNEWEQDEQQYQQWQNRNTWWQQQQQQDEEYEYGPYQSQYGQSNQVKANRAFAFAVKHNPSNQIVLVGRVIDGCQKPHGQQQGYQGQGQYFDEEY